MYRTGDLARSLSDGTFEFAGRVDLQTKVARARIEPQEIEAHLRRHTGIRDCAVAAREDSSGERRLVGYLVASAREDGSDGSSAASAAADARLHGSSRFHMARPAAVDSVYKVDRHALPAPAVDAPKSEHTPATISSDTSSPFGRTFSSASRSASATTSSTSGPLPARGASVRSHSTANSECECSCPCFSRTQRSSGLRRPSGGTRRSLETVLPVQASGSRPPLFVVPGTGSHLLYLRHLANRLGPDQPLYALHQPPDGNRAHRTVPELARKLHCGMRRIQPQGPYDLVGYSFGGVVAFEIAQQLVAYGEHGSVCSHSSTASFPTNPPAGAFQAPRARRVLRRAWPLLGSGADLGRRGPFRSCRSRAPSPLRPPGAHAGLKLRAHARGRERGGGRVGRKPDARAFTGYRPAPYPDQRTFLWAVQSPGGVGDTRHRWEDDSARRLRRSPSVPGTHWTAFEEPLLQFTARRPQRCPRRGESRCDWNTRCGRLIGAPGFRHADGRARRRSCAWLPAPPDLRIALDEVHVWLVRTRTSLTSSSRSWKGLLSPRGVGAGGSSIRSVGAATPGKLRSASRRCILATYLGQNHRRRSGSAQDSFGALCPRPLRRPNLQREPCRQPESPGSRAPATCPSRSTWSHSPPPPRSRRSQMRVSQPSASVASEKSPSARPARGGVGAIVDGARGTLEARRPGDRRSQPRRRQRCFWDRCCHRVFLQPDPGKHGERSYTRALGARSAVVLRLRHTGCSGMRAAAAELERSTMSSSPTRCRR